LYDCSQVNIVLIVAVKFTKSHEWIQYDANSKTAKIGISEYAQDQLGEIIHLEFEKIGKKV
jgi:glycine cleavage system H protein